MKYCVIILFGLMVQLEAYLIVQVRKANRSDADVGTVIHKGGTSNRRSMGARMRDAQDENGDSIQGRIDRRSDLRVGLDTGARRQSDPGVNHVIQMLSDAYDKYFGPDRNVKSVQLHDGSDTKRSLALQLKSESILRGVADFLASPKLKNVASEIARKAAIVYRAVESEL